MGWRPDASVGRLGEGASLHHCWRHRHGHRNSVGDSRRRRRSSRKLIAVSPRSQMQINTLAGLSRFQRQSGLCVFRYSGGLVRVGRGGRVPVLTNCGPSTAAASTPIRPPHNRDFKYIPLLAVSDVVNQEPLNAPASRPPSTARRRNVSWLLPIGFAMHIALIFPNRETFVSFTS